MCEINNFISLIIPHRSLFKLIINKFISVGEFTHDISVTTPLLVTYMIAVVSIYMVPRNYHPLETT